jgi:hypothetical protein
MKNASWVNGEVTTPAGLKKRFRQYEGGWIGLVLMKNGAVRQCQKC